MKNRAGSITVDFIFGMVIVAGVSSIVIALCMTMAMVEVTQYIAFASSRSYFGAHSDEARQIARGRGKFDNLMGTGGRFGTILNGAWFKVIFQGTGRFVDTYPANGPYGNDTFYGTRLTFRADVLNILDLPLLGKGNEENYSANVGSYLGREPTFQECKDNFVTQRWARFLQKYPLASSQTNAYFPIMDNGC